MRTDKLDTYPLPLNGLRYFYWAAKLGSFKAAAESLNVSEAAISQQIRNVESVLSVKLFERGHQKVTLTTKGNTLFPFVQTAFLNLQEGITNISSDPQPNRLTISTMPSFATNWLITRLVKFNQLHPDLSISIDSSIELLDFEKDTIDIAIRYGTGDYPRLRSEFIMHDPMVLVCHPDLVKNRTITKDDVHRLPAIIGTADGVLKTVNAFRNFYQVPDNAQDASLLFKDGSLGAEAARNGQGISIQRMSLVADWIESGELIYGTDFAVTSENFYAVAPASHFDSPKVIKFLNWIKSETAITAERIKPLVERIKT
ncbi:MAG: LysR family transcriptional regulator [Kangiellaceae bacterium]|nr:LysR family transcriptional regulator [Kangiellaceae bacterium]